MKLLDSNILIYACRPEHDFLLPLLADEDSCVSAISIPEVLGFPGLDPVDRRTFVEWFDLLRVMDVSRAVLLGAAELRRGRKMKLGDAIVAATALANGCELVTRDTTDFRGLGFPVIDPFKDARG